MPAILDVLRGRLRERELHSLDHVAEAARAAAAGKSYDLAALEAALAAQKMTLADFEKAIEGARRRALWLTQFDGLNAAISREKKLEAAIRSEEEKLEEHRLAVVARLRKVGEELSLATAARNAGEQARGQLLDPANVPGTIGIRYREAIEDRDAINVRKEAVARDLRGARSRLETHRSLAEQTIEQGRKRVECDTTLAQRAAKVEEYRDRAKSTARYVAEKEKELAAAEREAAAAEAQVKKMELEVLKA